MDMMPQENSSQDMIKSVLQKIIDEMGSLEADRIMPDHRKPKMVKMEVEAVKPTEEMDMEDEELDPAVLGELMDKAGQADESGELPEDKESDLPPEIAEAVKRRKEPK